MNKIPDLPPTVTKEKAIGKKIKEMEEYNSHR